MKGNRFLWVLLLAGALFVTSACRLADLIVENSSTRQPAVMAQAKSKAQTATLTRTPTPVTRAPAVVRVITVVVTPTETEFPPDFEFPTAVPEFPEPTEPRVLPANVPVQTDTPEPTEMAEPTETPAPTREFPYLVGSSDCRPNIRTFIEGIVFDEGEEKNGIIVRISMSPGGDPAPNDDYITGTDPDRPGYYFHNIDVNRPHGGLWYIFLLDPDTKRRISDIATVKTDSIRVEDDEKSAGSCQTAEVNFTTAGYDIQPTATITGTPTRTRTPTATGTPPTATPTVTGTPPTATPTVTGTPPTATPTSSPTSTRTNTPTTSG